MKRDIEEYNKLLRIYNTKIVNEALVATTGLKNLPASQIMKMAIEKTSSESPFYSGLLGSLKLIESETISGGTMSTNGTNIAYSPTFVKHLIDKYTIIEAIQAIVVHELLHVRYNHHAEFAIELTQGNEQLRKLVNWACDLAINDFLYRRPGFPKKENVFGPGISPNEEPFNKLPKGKDARYYFAKLLEYFKKQNEKQQQKDDLADEIQKALEQQGGEEQPDQGNQGQPDKNQKGQQSQDKKQDQSGQHEDGDGSGEASSDGEETDSDETEGSGSGDGSEAGEETDEQSDEAGSGGHGGDVGDGSETEGEGGEEGDSVGKTGKTNEKSSKGSSKTRTAGISAGDLSIPEINEILKNLPEELDALSKCMGEIQAPQEQPGKTMEEIISEIKQKNDLVTSRAKKDFDKLKEQGKLPTGPYTDIGIETDIEVKSKIPWDEIVNDFLTQSAKNERTYHRPSRTSVMPMPGEKNWRATKNPVLPSRGGSGVGEFVVVVDTSGSNVEASRKMFPEIATACTIKQFVDSSALRLVAFDSHIRDEYIFTNSGSDFESILPGGDSVPEDHVFPLEYDEGDKITGNDMNRFSLSHGGSTRITPVIDGLRRLSVHPPLVVIITDGEFYDSSDLEFVADIANNNPFDIIWILTRPSYSAAPLTGHAVYKLWELDY